MEDGSPRKVPVGGLCGGPEDEPVDPATRGQRRAPLGRNGRPSPTHAARGAAQTQVGVERPQGISLTGQAVDGDSGAPIPEAWIGFLEPGTDPEAWLAQPSADTVYSAGKTGANGEVTLSVPLQPGVEYPFVGLADGYKTISGCCFVVDPDATAEVTFTFVKAG